MRDVAGYAEELLRERVRSEGVELVHVEYRPGGSRSILRIYIDKPGGVDLGDCERVSKRASALLDVEDFISHPYVLEVSSPGIERPLFKEEDYIRFAGREVVVVTVDKIEDRRKFTGVIRGFRQGLVELECPGGTYRIPLLGIKKAHLVYRPR